MPRGYRTGESHEKIFFPWEQFLTLIVGAEEFMRSDAKYAFSKLNLIP